MAWAQGAWPLLFLLGVVLALRLCCAVARCVAFAFCVVVCFVVARAVCLGLCFVVRCAAPCRARAVCGLHCAFVVLSCFVESELTYSAC